MSQSTPPPADVPTTPRALPTSTPAVSNPAPVVSASTPTVPTSATGNAPASSTASMPTIQFDDFAKLELKVATVIDCQPHPNADKLLVLQIDLGSERRQICAGIKQWTKPEDLVGKQIVVVANLAPRMMRGQVSQGMLLAATDAHTGNVVVLSPSSPVAPGSGVK